MARIRNVQASIEGCELRARFETDVTIAPNGVMWRIFDPSTESLLFEGEAEASPEIRVSLPQEDGLYRVQIAPVNDGSRFVLVDVQAVDGKFAIGTARVTSAATVSSQRFLRAIPKAFLYPVRSIAGNHKLMASMVRRDILSRYRGSFGGSLWTFLNPLLLMATYFFLFGIVLQQRFGNDESRSGYVLYFLAGMLPWLAFSEAAGRSPSIMLEYRTFVKKIVFPLETLPVNLVIAGAVTEMFGLAIFTIGLLAARGAVPASVMWLPLLIVPQLLFTAGVCWFLAALGVFVRDLGQIIGFILTLWFFLTPICYPESQLARLPDWGMRILSWNPILVLVRGYRAVFLENRAPEFSTLLVLWIGAGVAAILGHAWFHRLRRSFADVI